MTYLGGLSGLLVTALWVFCVIDALSAPAEGVRTLPKVGWVIVVLLFPLVGSVAWLVAGRPLAEQSANLPYKGNRGGAAWPATRTSGFPESERPRRSAAAPDDDPDFLDRLRREKAASDAAHEDMLRQWEADLRRREEELRRDPPAGGPGDGHAPGDPDGGPTPGHGSR
ncbi:MAG TPA: PLD nuclease N-terminal domain-containing protein [Mycobacteriales bacterium]|jgi:hypothetical protein